MEYFQIAELNIGVEWENEEAKNEMYQRMDVAYFPPFFGAYVCEPVKLENLDLTVYYRNPDTEFLGYEGKVDVIYGANQIYVNEDGVDYEYIHRGMDKKVLNWVTRTTNGGHNVELIPVNRDTDFFTLKRLQPCFQQLLPEYNGLMIHGSAIEYRERGIIFSGFSGRGKTTQSRLWRKYRNAVVINGDSPTLRCFGNEVYMYGTPWCGTSGESVNRKVPLKAIVLINQSKDNRVEEVVGDAAVMAVYTNILYFSKNAEELDRMLPVLQSIVKNIRVYQLFCNMEEDAVVTLEKKLLADWGLE